jgi:acetate kinase
MNILIFNCGSSSLSYKIYRYQGGENLEVVVSGKAHRVGVTGTEPAFIEHKVGGVPAKMEARMPDHREAAQLILKFVLENGIAVDLIGHRFVHGGRYFRKSSLIDRESLKKLLACLPLAPIHNPASMSAISACNKILPKTRQYVTFDSAFHSMIPRHACAYALPKDIVSKFGFRKYGFHGLSYQYVSHEVPHFLGLKETGLKMIACHLGTGGSSVAAILGGRSVDTSMGFSPLPGLMMSTRSGDIDPMIAVYLMYAYGYRVEDIENLLNKRSGLLGVSGISSDIRDIIHRMDESGGEQEELAVDMYVHRLKKYIGSFVAVLKGLDVLVFTDDIGVGNPAVREKVCEKMEWSGIRLDKNANRNAGTDRICELKDGSSGVHILSIPTQEELVICREGIQFCPAGTGRKGFPPNAGSPSARQV